jgi:hypothetical protein
MAYVFPSKQISLENMLSRKAGNFVTVATVVTVDVTVTLILPVLAPLSLPPLKFVRPLRWCYRLWEIKIVSLLCP